MYARRAKLVGKAEKYSYSSDTTYLTGDNDILFTGDIVNSNSRNGYIKFFNDKSADSKQELKDFWNIIQQQKAIGNENFLLKRNEKCKVDFSLRKRGRPVK